MKTKTNISIGIDGITCMVSGCSLVNEMKFPQDSETPFLRLTPKGNKTEVALILPRTIRSDNKIGFRASDCKYLLDVIQKVNRTLKSVITVDWCEVFVQQLEVAVTVDLGVTDKLTIDSTLNFLSQVLLREDKENKRGKQNNVLKSAPMQKYVVGEKRAGCQFIYKELTKSYETNLWTNKRLKFKAYSKGAYSEFGGDTSIFRLEGVYCEKGIKHVLKLKEGEYITLDKVLKQKAIRDFIRQFKIDYREIIAPRIRGYLNESVQLIVSTIEKTSAYNSLLINKDILFDMRQYEKALRIFYKKHNKTDVAQRKMLCSVKKKMLKDGVKIPYGVIEIFELINKATQT